MIIEHYEQIGGHGDVVRALYKFKLRLPDPGDLAFTDGGTSVHWTLGAVVARNSHGRIIGAISYDRVEHTNSIFIYIGYVEPSARRKGVYRAMFDRLVEEARARNVLRIQGSTFITNELMMKVMEALGRKPVATMFNFDVPQGGAV